ncbi:MAG: hypothetical protein F6K11_31795 [Leptolyngbya sp. SIO3F4]|nr:hypothetical protein [Leptolyngbya sp. SIO3F4]
MQLELVVAIVSGLITLAASSLIAVYQSRTEFRKLRKQLEQTYTTSLFDRRLEVYPVLFKTLNRFNHRIEYDSPNKQQLAEFQHHYDEWVSIHAILLTPTTAKVVWGYHNYLIDVLEQYHDGAIPLEKWIEIRNIQSVIGKFLRAEIGVFDTTAAGIPELERPHVKAIIDKLQGSSQKIRNRFGY